MQFIFFLFYSILFFQITSTSEGNSNEVAASENEDSNRPNLGLSNRNRPVFIVLSQAQEEEGSAGEYRF